MNVDIVASRIRGSIEVTSKMLNSTPLRMEIEDTIRRNWKHPEKGALAQMTAAELAAFLAKAVIDKWPGQPVALQTFEEMLEPLKDIGALLNSDAVNEFVLVRDNPCVEADSRMPLQDFKKALCQRLFTRPTDPQQPAARD